MGIVVGFNWPISHDHCSAVIVDGRLVFASEEERHTRHKHSLMEPPFNSMLSLFNHLRRKFGILPQDVRDFAINFDPMLFTVEDRRRFSESAELYLANEFFRGYS